jgi:iron-sulfur cluster repair protein YtfE (RIC family)
MKATDVLERDHETLRALFVEHERAALHAERRRELFKQIRQELRKHSLDEERIYFPALLRSRSRTTRQLVRAGLEWHHAVDELLARIDDLDSEEEAFAEVLASLRRKIDQHIEAEAALADAGRHLSNRALEHLGSEMQAAAAASASGLGRGRSARGSMEG